MDENYSGVSQYTANLLSAILDLDKDNEYRLFYNSWRNLDTRLALWQRPNSRVIGRHYPNKLFNYILQKGLAWPKLDQALGGVDLFFSPHFNFSALSSRTKKIITVHDLSFLRYPEFFSRRKNFWHRALKVKKILRAADRIIAVSESTKSDIVELIGAAPEKVRVIYSGNNLSGKRPSEPEISAWRKTKNITGRFILSLGTIEPRKNIAGLIEAFNSLKDQGAYSDIKLVLAGARGWKNQSVAEAFKASPYQEDIIFLGYVSPAEQAILYASAEVFVYPSFYEGFGFPPLEAMSYGRPVICSNNSSLPEVVGEAGLMINPDQPAEISAAWRLILDDENLRNRLKEKGLARAKLFSWPKAAGEYLALFNELSQHDEKAS